MLRRLKAQWGTEGALRRLDREELEDVSHCFHALAPRGDDGSAVDDTTWHDLDMDDVFRSIDASMSIAGSEALYAMLRDLGAGEEALARRDRLALAFQEDEAFRLKAQSALSGVGRQAFHGAWRYLCSDSAQIPKHAWVYPVLSLLPLAMAVLGFVSPVFLMLAGGAFGLNLFVHFRSQVTWEKEARALRHIGAATRCAGQLAALAHPALDGWRARIARHQEKLRAARFWLPMFGVQPLGDMAIAMEYIRIFFLMDMVSFVAIVRAIARHREDARLIYALVGEVDACQSIAQLRLRETGLCTPVFHGERRLTVTGIRHPLIRDAVANDLDLSGHLLLTGSNASGKSTFIKAVGVNIILAQSLCLCFANSMALCRAA